MRYRAAGAAGVLAVVAMIGFGAPARADDPVFFNYRGVNCAVSADGLLGCDIPDGSVVTERPGFLPSGSADDLTLPVAGRQITQDTVGGPMHAVSLPGTPFTLPGGNPAPVLAPNGCPGQGCTPIPRLLGTSVVCGDGHYMTAGCRAGSHGFSLIRPGQVTLY